MTISFSDEARQLLNSAAFAVLATLNSDGSPQTSVIWVKLSGGTAPGTGVAPADTAPGTGVAPAENVVFSTILGRRKTRNMQRDPRVSLCVYDPHDPYRYVEVRGRVSLTEEGGPELIQELSRRYTGHSFTERRPDSVRVVVTLHALKIVERE